MRGCTIDKKTTIAGHSQYSIFDIFDLSEPNQPQEPPILLSIGQTVYKVIRGDVKELYVYDEKPWICGTEDDPERGYRLKEKDGCYDCTWNRSIGVNVFTDQNQAMQVAENHLKSNQCIRKEAIKAIKTFAYSYIRESDNREMISFYSILDSGMVYIKEFMTYQHIRKDVDKAIKDFMDGQRCQRSKISEIDYEPVYKNMYPCKNDSGWIYAEAAYNSWLS